MPKATVSGKDWSDPSAWDGGAIPRPSNGLDVVSKTPGDSLGTAAQPFVTHDVTQNQVSQLFVFTGGLTTHNFNGGVVWMTDHGYMDVQHDLTAVVFVLTDAGYLRVGHDINSTISFIGYGARGAHENATDAALVVDHPPNHQLTSEIAFPTGAPTSFHPAEYPFGLKIELAHMNFDRADFIPNSGTATNGFGDSFTLRLSEAGKAVYDLTDVRVPVDGHQGTLSVGHDATTGYDFVAYTKTV
jgi:hypothetical protein